MNSTAEIENLFNRFTKISEDLSHQIQTTDDGDKKKQMKKDFTALNQFLMSIFKYKSHLLLTNIY